MYGDNLSSFSIEGILFDKTRELGSLARALPGLSLSSVAFPQWPTKPVKNPRTKQAPRCRREQERPPVAASPLVSSPTVVAPSSVTPTLASPSTSPYVSYTPASPPRPRADSTSTWWSLCPECSTCLHENAWPQLSCEHGSFAELHWPDGNRWSRGSIDSTSSVALTTSSTISDSVLESTDDEATLLSRPSSPVKAAPKEPRPPRPCLQPAKTGFALWVGNLSARTTLLDLCELFGTPEIQSIYLIQRTGCAFVNYSSGAALDAAIDLFHSSDGRLHDHELVIKAQRVDEEQQHAQAVPPPVNSPDRFFICKSLTTEDLESAKQKGLWSTQLRNRDKFNEAFNQAENVYLVFSANRTSAFYGFARLETPFGEDMSPESETPESGYDDSGFEITRTPATCDSQGNVVVPAGEIVLDPLRGSQFWKVDSCPYAECDTEKWAAPAKITWLSPPNNSVSFSRTRQLKNSLNQNKPVKVARDGTEIDPAVGRELCEMFH